MPGPTSLLFVCLGNICRSPLAKFITRDLIEQRGLTGQVVVDSCGTGGWHEGHGADPRTVAVAAFHGLDTSHTARQLRAPGDFERFDLLLAMDLENQRNLVRSGAPAARVRLMRSFDPALAGAREDALSVPDPYYGGPDGFEAMYRMLHAACTGLIDAVEAGQSWR